jgi:hypothetical protein
MQARASAERRIYPRHRVRVAMLWKGRRPEPMSGEICDVSAQGLFVVSTTAIPDEVGVGDSTQITVSTESGRETLSGVVRWRGYHPAHQAIGCGIQLDKASAGVIVRLFPAVLEAGPSQGTAISSPPSPFGPSGKNRATS